MKGLRRGIRSDFCEENNAPRMFPRSHRQTHMHFLTCRHTVTLSEFISKVPRRKVEGPPAGSKGQDLGAPGGIPAEDAKVCA